MPATPDAAPESPPRNAPPDPPAYRPFPEIAQAMRAQATRILDEWRARTLASMPELGELPVKEFQDDIARILAAMADALESNAPPDLRRLVQIAPAHGLQRFIQQYDLAELFAEERVLRRVIVSRVEAALSRQCRPDEAAALHAMIDIMLQQGVLALVQQQKQELRRSSETQLKYLSFLSHDLGNNFSAITMNLQFLERRLARAPGMEEGAEVIAASLATIRRTRDGMHRLLEHERLRASGTRPGASPVNLREIVEPVVKLALTDPRCKDRCVHLDIDPAAVADTDPDLLTIILQNLIGNAMKHAAAPSGSAKEGSVRILAEHHPAHPTHPASWTLSVTDDGPGIPADQLERLFKAFEQLPKPGDKAFDDDRGFGLGLAIASQAARLLGTTIHVHSTPGHGSTFSIKLPAPTPQP